MEAREHRVIDAALTIAESKEPGRHGFIDSVVLAVRTWRSARRYERQLREAVGRQLDSIVYGRLAGDDLGQPESLTPGLLFDFPVETRELVRQRSEPLETMVREVAESVAAELLDEIALRTAGVQHLQDELFDKTEMAGQVRGDLAEPPSDESESLKRSLDAERALNVVYATFGRLRAALVLALVQIGCVFGLESLLVFLSLMPVLAGTAGVVQWMIAAQAIVLTAVILFFGHLLWSRSRGIRWLAAGALVVITSALAMIRAGVIGYGPGSGADGAITQDPTAWAIIAGMALSGFGLAAIGGQASHRAKTIIERAARLRSTAGKGVAEMEADLAAWKSARARRRSRRRELQRLLPRLERDISRLEAALRSQMAGTRQLVQRRVRDAVRRRLSSEISNMAQQLGRWSHDPRSAKSGSATPPSVTAVLVLGLTLFAGASCTRPDHVHVHHTLLDTSGSMSPHVTERMKAAVVEAVRSWVRTASTGDEFTVWWLTAEGSPYPADRETLTMPPLNVPAYAGREAFTHEAVRTLEDWLAQLPQGVQRTRLLESLYYIASTEARLWAITILSDLREDSPNWDIIRAGNTDNAGLLKAMLELCPTVTIPPVAVSLVSWPGLVSGNRGGIKEHEDARRLFTQFFERWAPEAELRVVSI